MGWVPALAARVRTRLTGVHVLPSPNIWQWPELYEVENRAQDSTGELWRVLRAKCDWSGLDVLDVGCGDGFHLPVFASDAASVTGVEPHPPLVARAKVRVRGTSNVRVLEGPAQRLPLPDASVDLVHARTAYFFGPGCEPGLVEADRVLRPGGTLAIIDLDGARPPYGPWLCADVPGYEPAAVERFFADQGFSRTSVDTVWRFQQRADLESVLRIEFSQAVADRAIAQTSGTEFPVAYRLHLRRKPTGLILP
ncbi:class I SAM-dependent methyltransferase [Kutzneria viridogrisea]|nr:class I SAM-dependent methyltransferase [Kutzneria albida]